MKTKFLLLVFYMTVISNIAQSQTIASDSKGKDIFNFYKSKAFSLPVTAATSSFKTNYTLKGRDSNTFGK